MNSFGDFGGRYQGPIKPPNLPVGSGFGAKTQAANLGAHQTWLQGGSQGPQPQWNYTTPVAGGFRGGAQHADYINKVKAWEGGKQSPSNQMHARATGDFGVQPLAWGNGDGGEGFAWNTDQGGAAPAPNTSVWGQNAGNAPSHAAQVAQSQAAEQGFTAAGNPLKQYQSPGRSLDPGSQVLADQRNLGQFADTYAQIGAIPHQMSLQDAMYNRAGQEINNSAAYTQANALRQLQGAEYTAQNQRQNDVLTLLQSILG
jgi:hypothetical protein